MLLVDYRLDGDDALVPHVLLASRLGEGVVNNRAWAEDWHGHPVLWAEQGHPGLATGDKAVLLTSASLMLS